MSDGPVERSLPEKVTLKEPIKVGGEMVTELVLSGSPQLRHLKGVRVKIGAGGAEFDIGDVPKVIAPMANIPPSSAEQISVTDLAELLPAFLDFFGFTEE